LQNRERIIENEDYKLYLLYFLGSTILKYLREYLDYFMLILGLSRLKANFLKYFPFGRRLKNYLYDK